MEKEDYKEMRKTLRDMSKVVTMFEENERKHNNAKNLITYDDTKDMMKSCFEAMKHDMEHLIHYMNIIGYDCDTLAYNEFLKIHTDKIG